MYHSTGDPNFFFNCMSYDKNRTRRERTTYNQQQLDVLEKVFKQTHYPDCYKREELSARIGIAEAKIQTWFKNRRAREKNRRCPSGSGGKMVGKLTDESPPDPDGCNSSKSVSALSPTPFSAPMPAVPSISLMNSMNNACCSTPEQWWSQSFQGFKYPAYNSNYTYPYNLMNYRPPPYGFYHQNTSLPTPSSSSTLPPSTNLSLQPSENSYNMPFSKPF